MKKLIAAALMAASFMAAPAFAATDSYASAAIAQHDYTAAEAQLKDYLAKDRDDPPALLNLAYVYRQTGREAQAIAVYNTVLARVDTRVAKLDNGNIVMSHEIAEAALDRKTRMVASR